jgi:hypothetical protein
MEEFPERVMLPGLLISLVVLSVNYLGDGLRDALDPRIRGRYPQIGYHEKEDGHPGMPVLFMTPVPALLAAANNVLSVGAIWNIVLTQSGIPPQHLLDLRCFRVHVELCSAFRRLPCSNLLALKFTLRRRWQSSSRSP